MSAADPGIQSSDLEKIAAKNAETMNNLVKALETQKADVQRYGETTKATRDLIDTVKTEIKAIADKVVESEKAIEKLQLRANRTLADAGFQAEDFKSAGQAFVDSEIYKGAIGDGAGPLRSKRHLYKSFEPFIVLAHADHELNQFKHFGQALSAKAATVTTSAGSAGSLVDVFATLRLAQLISAPWERIRLSQIIPTTRTADSQIQFVRETAFHRIWADVTVEAASGQAVVTVTNTRGFMVGKPVKIRPGHANEETRTILSINHTNKTLTMTANLSNTHPVSTEGTPVAVVSDYFQYTPEVQLKPNAKVELETVTVGMRTLATLIAVSRQALRNATRLRNHIDTRLMQSLASQRDRHVLYGGGGDSQLSGVFTDPKVKTYNWSSGFAGDSRVDAMRRAATLVQLGQFDPTAYVLHPTDWERVELEKGDDGHYLWWAVVNQGVARIWGLPVVSTTSIDQGDFGVGAWNVACELFEQEGTSGIRFSEDHEDYFARNMAAILAETDHALAKYLPESIVYGKFDSKPATP